VEIGFVECGECRENRPQIGIHARRIVRPLPGARYGRLAR